MIKPFYLRESGEAAVLLKDHQAEIEHQHQGLKNYARTLAAECDDLRSKLVAAVSAAHQNTAAMYLVRDLLDPEMYGYAVSAEVRDRARQVLWIPPCEAPVNVHLTVDSASSLNHDAAWRDAMGIKP